MKSSRAMGIGISYIGIILNMVCGLFLSSFLVRRLGDGEYGLYQTVAAFATYLVLLEFGTGTVMSRNIAVCRSNNNKSQLENNISTIWFITVALSMLIVIFSIMFYFGIGIFYKKTMNAEQIAYARKIFIFVIGYLLASFYTQTLNGFLLGYEQYTFSKTVDCIRIISRTILLTAIIFSKPYAIFIAIIDMILSIVSLIVTYLYCKNVYNIRFKLNKFDKGILMEALPLCIAMLIQSLVNQANNNVDKFVIGVMVSMESVTIYSVAQYIYSVFSSATTIPIGMYLPQVAKYISEGKKGKELTDELIEPCRFVTLVGGMILFGFFSIGRPFINIIYGAKYSIAWIYALIIMTPMFINMTNGIIINILDVLKKRIVRSLVLLWTTIINVILTIILIHKIGLSGAVIATAIATLLGQILIMNIYYEKKLGIKVVHLFKKSYKGILPSLMIASAISFIVSNQIKEDFYSFFIGGVMFVLLSFSLLLKFGLNEKEKIIIKQFLTKIKK